MSDFKANMHQIRFPLGLAPDPAREHTALPRSVAVFKDTSKGSEGEVGGNEMEGEQERRRGKIGGEVKGGEGDGREKEERRGEEICRTIVKLLPARL